MTSAVRQFPEFRLPPWREGHDGRERRCGVEVEFVGLDSHDVARLIADTFNGQVSPVDAVSYEVETELGLFDVTFDASWGHPKPRDGHEDDFGRWFEEHLRAAAVQLTRDIVPTEVSGPPMLLSDLPRFDILVRALGEAGARGTGSSLTAAFGLHLNPSVPSLEPMQILRFLQAFLLLEDWLRQKSDLDLTRRMLPFIDPFPPRFHARALEPGLDVDRDRLIDLYCADNPTRNRDLDLLPLLSFLDADRVKAQIPPDKLKPRPAYHYRLPDCHLGVPGWSILSAWNDWIEVERLAAAPERLEAMIGDWWRVQRSGHSRDWPLIVAEAWL